MEYNYPLGAFPSPKDERDYTVTVTAPRVWPESDFIPDGGIGHYQQIYGTCVAQSIRYGFARINKENYGTAYVYGGGRPNGPESEGMFPNDAANFIVKEGCALEADDPYELFWEDAVLFYNTKRGIIPIDGGWTWARLYTVDEIKAAIADRRHIIFCTPVITHYTDGFGWYATSSMSGLSPIGYHEMVIMGYGQFPTATGKKEGVLVRNSWGDFWGKDGNCYMTWEDVLALKDVIAFFPPDSEPESEEQDHVTVRRTLRKGMVGEDVKEAQGLLTDHGFPCGKIDGIFGQKTYDATVAFQKASGLVADGIIGPKTWAALDEAPEPGPQPVPPDHTEEIQKMEALLKMTVGDYYIIGAQGNILTKHYLDTRKAAEPAYFTGGRYEWLCGEIEKGIQLGKTLYCADCSGLFWWVNAALHIVSGSDSTADGLYRNYCTPITKGEVRPGDILFRDSNGKKVHMAIVGFDGVYEAAGTAYGVVFRKDIFSRETINRMTGKTDTLKAWTHYGRLKVWG